MKRRGRWLGRGALALFFLLILAIGWVWWLLHGSLPALEGELALPGLSAPVQVQRDVQGVVSIRAANATDAARALGFVHGQERFFEMDLLRRSASGELSELFGAIAVAKDRQARVHRLRARTTASLPVVAGARMPQLLAYTEGVNAGLASLRSKPWPYFLLKTEPRPWQAADTALAGYAMFFDLQDESNSRELALWKIRQVLPPALYSLVAADGTEWDAPLLGAARGNLRLPGPAELDMRRLPMPDRKRADRQNAELAAPGSNNFAVAGALTADGRAILANDMHLTLRAPNIWFRARLQYADAAAPGGRVDVSGFTLPGIPSVVVGSNGHVAWGFTNSYGDWLDFYRVRWTDSSRNRYRTPLGDAAVQIHEERIHVKGGADVLLPVRETVWGPITEELPNGESLALRWAAHRPGSINLGLAAMPNARDLDDALRVAGGIGIPAQNLLLADGSGRIAWRLTARMPNRVGDCDISAPIDPMHCGWSGWRGPAQNPSLVDPPGGRLWTANARTADGEALALLGDSGYALGARAKQIRDALYARPRFSERDLLAIQLDDRALLHERWWRLLRAQATASRTPAWGDIEIATRKWEGRAAPDAVSFRIVREWRLAVLQRIKEGLLAPAMAAMGKDFVMPDLPQFEGVAWQLASQRPQHLLPRAYASWDELFLDAAREVDNELLETGPLGERTWGERNRAAICHPLASALPFFTRRWTCMPPDPLPGDLAMPRIASPDFGASERMVVSPGHEAEGIIEMPGGQSGHPLSPYWGAGHQAWVRGEATPFLPGAAEHSLVLRPAPKR